MLSLNTYNAPMESTDWRRQLRFVAWGYAAVLLIAAIMLYGRHLQELKYPVDAAGGMWAAGDTFLYFFVACLFMIPTAFLIWVIAKVETVYKVYSQFLLGLSLSAPVSLILLNFGEGKLAEGVISVCLLRLLGAPLILFGIGVSRWVARFDRTKMLTSLALVVEGLTLATAVVLLIHSVGAPNHR
jgi:hypothetical protein